ncbi:MAG TPA: hypothetical protein DCM05_16920 [Elusimicrobia bacterium]|nr:hypothetical protein [Elusimicrobiota bacterium]
MRAALFLLRRIPPGVWTLLGAFLLCALLLDPLNPFPLDDDWGYALSVRMSMAAGAFVPSEAQAVSMAMQVLWGWLFCLPFGFSMEALRLSTMVLSWLGLLAFYGSLRELDLDDAWSAAGALCLLFNPLFFILSFTFMTDVPALSWMLLSGFAFLRGLKNGDERWLAAGAVLSGFAYLVRQPGLALSAAAVLWMLFSGKGSKRACLLVGGIALAFAAGHALWAPRREGVHELVWLMRGHAADLPSFAADLLRRSSGAVLYLGLFLLPWAAGGGIRKGGKAAALSLLGLFACVWVLGLGPQTGNLVGRFGLGTCTLTGSCGLKASGIFGSPAFWSACFLAGLASALSLACRIGLPMEFLKGPAGAWSSGFLLAFLPYLPPADFYDRYYLVLFPPAIALAAAVLRPARLAFGLGLCALAAWCLFGAGDYLAWNRAKWRAGAILCGQGLRPEEVSNGFDWNDWFNYERRLAELGGRRPSGGHTRHWWDESRMRAAVSFASGTRSEELRPAGRVGYWSPLTFRTEYLYLWVRARPAP